MKIFAIVLFALLSATLAQAATSRIDVTGRVTSVYLFGYLGDNFRDGRSFKIDDPELIGWNALDAYSMTSGSMTLRETLFSGENYIIPEDCTGILYHMCFAYVYDSTLTDLEFDDFRSCTIDCNVEFSPEGYYLSLDSEDEWQNSLGIFQLQTGLDITVEFDSFLVDGTPFPHTVPVVPALPLAATAFGLLCGLRRLQHRP